MVPVLFPILLTAIQHFGRKGKGKRPANTLLMSRLFWNAHLPLKCRLPLQLRVCFQFKVCFTSLAYIKLWHPKFEAYLITKCIPEVNKSRQTLENPMAESIGKTFFKERNWFGDIFVFLLQNIFCLKKDWDCFLVKMRLLVWCRSTVCMSSRLLPSAYFKDRLWGPLISMCTPRDQIWIVPEEMRIK